MKLLLDMGVSPRTAEYLRARGHDAVHLRELGLIRMSDGDIAAKARAEQRTVVTFDLDFSRIMAMGSFSSPSLIVFRLDQFTTDRVNQKIADLLLKYAVPLQQGAIVTVQPRRVRLRMLPLR